MTIPREKGLRTSIDPGSVRVQDEYGGGYMGMLEVFHQLHCLVRPSHFISFSLIAISPCQDDVKTNELGRIFCVRR